VVNRIFLKRIAAYFCLVITVSATHLYIAII